MNDPRPEPDVPNADPPATDVEERDPAAPTPIATADEPSVEGEAPRRSDPLAAGVAVAVMAALLICVAVVLIAAGNG